MSAEERREYIGLAQTVNAGLQYSRLPVVAAVNGHAIGAGLELALSADFVVVARDAKLRLPEVALGTFVGGGVTYRLPRRVGDLKARELILAGGFFSGEDAVAMGLANRALPPEEVLEAALELAKKPGGECAPVDGTGQTPSGSLAGNDGRGGDGGGGGRAGRHHGDGGLGRGHSGVRREEAAALHRELSRPVTRRSREAGR